VGILAAVPTAITGLSDLTDIVDDDERSIATAHALANVGGLALWSLSYFARKDGRRRTGTALGMAATAAMTAAGFLGGHLSYRLGVGVDQTTFDPKLDEWTDVMDDGELEAGQPRRVMVSGINVFLLRTGGRIHALANRCSHRGGPLHKGKVDAETVTCPWHLSSFRLKDGSVLRGPATAPQPAYEARVSDGKVQIRDRPQDRAR
jgi:nitrite reductase/ring-hydroxylating ferredoxin subunit